MEHYYFYHDDIKTGLRGEKVVAIVKLLFVLLVASGFILDSLTKETLENFQSKSGKIFADKKDFKTWEGHVAESKIKRKALDKGLSFYKKRYNKNIPKTIEELQEELEVV